MIQSGGNHCHINPLKACCKGRWDPGAPAAAAKQSIAVHRRAYQQEGELATPVVGFGECGQKMRKRGIQLVGSVQVLRDVGLAAQGTVGETAAAGGKRAVVPAPGGGTPTRVQAAGQQKYFLPRSASHLLLALAVLQGQVLARAVGAQAAAAAAQQEVPLERDQGQVGLQGGAGQGGWDVRGGCSARGGAGSERPG